MTLKRKNRKSTYLRTDSTASNICRAVPPGTAGMSRILVFAPFPSLKMWTRMVRHLASVLSLLLSIIWENGPVLHLSITGFVKAGARLPLITCIVFMCLHVKLAAASQSRNIRQTRSVTWSAIATRRLCSATNWQKNASYSSVLLCCLCVLKWHSMGLKVFVFSKHALWPAISKWNLRSYTPDAATLMLL